MITELLLDLVSFVLGVFLTLLPEWTIPLPSGLETAISWLKGFDEILPVTEGLQVASLCVGYVAISQGVKWTVKVIDWIMDVIP